MSWLLTFWSFWLRIWLRKFDFGVKWKTLEGCWTPWETLKGPLMTIKNIIHGDPSAKKLLARGAEWLFKCLGVFHIDVLHSALNNSTFLILLCTVHSAAHKKQSELHGNHTINWKILLLKPNKLLPLSMRYQLHNCPAKCLNCHPPHPPLPENIILK